MLNEHIKNWQALIDTLPYPVSVIDNEFNVVTVNKPMMVLYGMTGQPKDLKCYKLFHRSESPVKDCPALKTMKTGNPEQTEITDPSLGKTFILNASPIILDGNTAGVLHSISDITDHKESLKSKDELIDIYTTTLNELKSQAVNAQKGRDAFLNMLEDVNDSYKELEELFLKLILVMVNALDAKSPWTKGHSERVSMYAEQIAKELLIDQDEIKNIRLAGLLHDIGKIGTYDYLLNKPDKLTMEEFDIVKKHPVQGADILKDIKQLNEIIPFIRYHHEKLDGNGYPEKIRGEKIPLGARILHVADSFDSMTSDRPYRPAPGIEFALSELEKYKGSQFDQDVVEAFLNVLKKRQDSGKP